MKLLVAGPLRKLAMRRAALVLDIGRQRMEILESTTAMREQFAWAGVAVMAGQSLRSRGWARALTLGALALAVIRRFKRDPGD